MNEKAIAALMVKKKLPFSRRISKHLAGIEWEKYENKMYLLEKKAKEILEQRDIPAKEVDLFIDKVNKKILESKFEKIEINKNQVSMFSFQ